MIAERFPEIAGLSLEEKRRLRHELWEEVSQSTGEHPGPGVVELLEQRWRQFETKETMTTKAKPIPDGYHTVTPYLIITNAAKAIDFYKEVFGATELERLATPDGKVGHAEIKIGDSRIMLADEFPEWDARSPQTIGGSAVCIMLYVEDVDMIISRAVAAGAKLFKPVQDQFYGDRSGTITDPFGHKWTIATHIEDVSPEEMRRRASALFGMS